MLVGLTTLIVLVARLVPGLDAASVKKDSCSDICGLAIEDKSGREQVRTTILIWDLWFRELN